MITSCDPMAAYILDGEAVLEWCSASLSRLEVQILDDFHNLNSKHHVCEFAVKAEGVQTILRALQGIVNHG